MKKIFLALVAFVFINAFVPSVSANEGTVSLSGSEVACEGVSLWKSRNYRVMGRCDGLVYPYETQYGHYVLWAVTDAQGDVVRVGEVDGGYFDGNVSESFNKLFVTAEEQSISRKPSSYQVASGAVSKFAFDKSSVSESVEVATNVEKTSATAQTQETITVQGTETSADAAGSTVGDVVGKIVKSLLIIILVVVVLVVGTSLIFRRRGSVSS